MKPKQYVSNIIYILQQPNRKSTHSIRWSNRF